MLLKKKINDFKGLGERLIKLQTKPFNASNSTKMNEKEKEKISTFLEGYVECSQAS